MYFFFIGLLFVAFQVTCYGAPERLIPVPQLPAGVSEEVKHVEKRTLCTNDQLDQSSGCGYWNGLGYCAESSPYYDFMQSTCFATCGGCEPPPTPVPQVDDDDCLQAHNEKRALHQNTPNLVWDASLAQQAKNWADHLAEVVGDLQHSQGTGQGENLYWGTGLPAKTCREAVQSWYSEEPLYGYDNPPETSQEFYAGGYGHFTQVVWKGTTHVGAGLKKIVNSNGVTETYVVARYSPQGNILGQFGSNVEEKNP